MIMDEKKAIIISRKFKVAIQNIKASRYFYANVLYVIYSTGMLLIDWGNLDTKTDNMLYIIFGFVHVVNAAMYLWMWAELRPTIFSFFCMADWLNVLGSFLYLWSAFLYSHEYSSDDDNASKTASFQTVRYIELIAAIVEVFAAIGWVMQWHIECSKTEILGRGFTLDGNVVPYSLM
jgi:hypothetical protein